ncbi:MAG: TPM domain-containing protein [Ruminococcus sp.]|nr:TPM domain-containing protein [Ruminococcus sp.]
MIKYRNFPLFILTIMLFLSFMSGISVSANGYSAIICDDYNALTDEQETELTQYLYNKSQEANVNIAVVITDATNKYGAMDYADVYEENLFGIDSNSILYLINMNDDYDWISCSGTAIDYYPQHTIDYILQNTSGVYLISQNDNMDFYGAIQSYGDLVVSQQTLPMSIFTKIGVSFFVSLIVSLIVCCIIASRYKFHKRTNANIYTERANGGGVTFTKRRDTFIRTYTTKTARSENSGTHTHTSSGGGTHSGGGFQR